MSIKVEIWELDSSRRMADSTHSTLDGVHVNLLEKYLCHHHHWCGWGDKRLENKWKVRSFSPDVVCTTTYLHSTIAIWHTITPYGTTRVENIKLMGKLWKAFRPFLFALLLQYHIVRSLFDLNCIILTQIINKKFIRACTYRIRLTSISNGDMSDTTNYRD